MKKIQYSLIPAHGADELIFDYFEHEKIQSNIEEVNEQSIKEFKELDSVQNFRIVLGKSKEYLAKIIENSSYKKLLKQTIAVAKEDLNFDKKYEKTLSLEQKINNKNKMSSPKPKF